MAGSDPACRTYRPIALMQKSQPRRRIPAAKRARAVPAASAAPTTTPGPTAEPAKRKRKSDAARSMQPSGVTLKWVVQRAGLSKEVRDEMSGVIKHGKTAAQQMEEAEASKRKAAADLLNLAAARAGAADQPATADSQQQAESAAPHEPKRSHHKQCAQLRAPLPIDWEQITRARGQVPGIRRRVSKLIRDAPMKNSGGSGTKSSFVKPPLFEQSLVTSQLATISWSTSCATLWTTRVYAMPPRPRRTCAPGPAQHPPSDRTLRSPSVQARRSGCALVA